MKPVKENAVYFPLTTLYSKYGALDIKSWDDVFIQCKVNDNKDMKILVKFKDNKNVRRNYDRDYLAYRQILIGTGDKIFYFKQVQENFVGNVLDVGYDLYNWIEKQGLDFDCFYKLDGQQSGFEPDTPPGGVIANPGVIFNTYDIVVLR